MDNADFNRQMTSSKAINPKLSAQRSERGLTSIREGGGPLCRRGIDGRLTLRRAVHAAAAASGRLAKPRQVYALRAEMVGAGKPRFVVYLGIRAADPPPRRDGIMYTRQGAKVGRCASCPQ